MIGRCHPKHLIFRILLWMALYTQVQAQFRNVALLKPTVQSSTDTGRLPSRAVDGDVNANMEAGSCAMTLKESEPWWAVDLEGLFVVHSVYVVNRQDCCQIDMREFRLELGNSSVEGSALKDLSSVTFHECLDHPDFGTKFDDITIMCGNASARYVRFSLPQRQAVSLQVCEVMVFAKEALEASSPTSTLEVTSSTETWIPQESTDFSSTATCLADTECSSTAETLSLPPSTTDTMEESFSPSSVSDFWTSSQSMAVFSSEVESTTSDLSVFPTTSHLSSMEEVTSSVLPYASAVPSSVPPSAVDLYTPPTRQPKKDRQCSCTCKLKAQVRPTLGPVTSLKVNKTTLSSHRRQMTSASDDRASAFVMGMVGIVFMTLVLGTLVVSDVVSLCNRLATKAGRSRVGPKFVQWR